MLECPDRARKAAPAASSRMTVATVRRLRRLAQHYATSGVADDAGAAVTREVPRDPAQGAGPGGQGFGPRGSASTQPPGFRCDQPTEVRVALRSFSPLVVDGHA